jgi:hypothetical protein
MNKRKALRLHVKKRSSERIGSMLSKTEQKSIVAQIKGCQNASFVRRLSNSRTEWQIFWDGKVFPVVYDTTRHALITVLPPDSMTRLMPRMIELLEKEKIS